MIAVLLLGILACAGAAPRYHNDRLFDRQFESNFENFLTDDFFDTQRFWEDMRREMADLDKRIADLTRHFTPSNPTQGIEGDQFVVRMSLTGYTEKEIRVQAKEGIVMVQAVHDNGHANKNSFLVIRTLPDYVTSDGNWTFKDGVLKITFPVKRDDATPSATSTVSPVDDREELDANGADIDVRDADVGSAGAEGVEATTYAVNLKEDVEFVPIQYK